MAAFWNETRLTMPKWIISCSDHCAIKRVTCGKRIHRYVGMCVCTYVLRVYSGGRSSARQRCSRWKTGKLIWSYTIATSIVCCRSGCSKGVSKKNGYCDVSKAFVAQLMDFMVNNFVIVKHLSLCKFIYSRDYYLSLYIHYFSLSLIHYHTLFI